MKFENTEVFNFRGALRGMRAPLESWDKSDTIYGEYYHIHKTDDEVIFPYPVPKIGPNDMKLAQNLVKGGPPHRKFLRQIEVCVDITAPLYWWKEFDTYKVGTTANSTSTMHKLATTPITRECFEMDDFKTVIVFDKEPFDIDDFTNDVWDYIIDVCETLRKKYLETKDKRYWKELIRLLPESWLQTRTVTMTYENIYNMVEYRKDHKLNEWSGKDDDTKDNFIKWVHTLPYADEFIFLEK